MRNAILQDLVSLEHEGLDDGVGLGFSVGLVGVGLVGVGLAAVGLGLQIDLVRVGVGLPLTGLQHAINPSWFVQFPPLLSHCVDPRRLGLQVDW